MIDEQKNNFTWTRGPLKIITLMGSGGETRIILSIKFRYTSCSNAQINNRENIENDGSYPIYVYIYLYFDAICITFLLVF